MDVNGVTVYITFHSLVIYILYTVYIYTFTHLYNQLRWKKKQDCQDSP